MFTIQTLLRTLHFSYHLTDPTNHAYVSSIQIYFHQPFIMLPYIRQLLGKDAYT